MRTLLDRDTYETEATVTVKVRDLLDCQDFDCLFDYLLKLYPKELKESAIEAFDLVEKDDEPRLMP